MGIFIGKKWRQIFTCSIRRKISVILWVTIFVWGRFHTEDSKSIFCSTYDNGQNFVHDFSEIHSFTLRPLFVKHIPWNRSLKGEKGPWELNSNFNHSVKLITEFCFAATEYITECYMFYIVFKFHFGRGYSLTIAFASGCTSKSSNLALRCTHHAVWR